MSLLSQQQIVEAVLQLPEAVRAQIAEQILESLSPETQVEFDEKWAEELERRVDEHLRNPEQSVPWDEIKKRN